MADMILENDESEVTNVEQEEVKVEETKPDEKQPVEEQSSEPSPETAQEEPTISIDGQQVPLSQAKEALEIARNQKEWNRKNTQSAQDIAEQKRQLQEIAFIAERMKSRPDLLQKLFTPEPVRDLDAELRDHYSRMPIDMTGQEFVNWNWQRDQMVKEQAKQEALRENESRISKMSIEQHNNTVDAQSWEKYKAKVSQDEFKQMAEWAVKYVRADNGRFPTDTYDIAYRSLYGDKMLEEAKLESTKRTNISREKAKPADVSANGVNKSTETDLDEDDDAFVQEMKARNRK